MRYSDLSVDPGDFAMISPATYFARGAVVGTGVMIAGAWLEQPATITPRMRARLKRRVQGRRDTIDLSSARNGIRFLVGISADPNKNGLIAANCAGWKKIRGTVPLSPGT